MKMLYKPLIIISRNLIMAILVLFIGERHSMFSMDQL